MSERGMILALQRIHDDPGFTDRVSEDPQNTLGIYDLDESECDTLINAVKNRDGATIRRMASNVGIDWTADHIAGPGALDEKDVSTEGAVNTGIKGPDTLPGDGYDGVVPHHIPGT